MEPSEAAARGPEAEAPPTLLCVDDEANILSALKRLFRPHGYRVLTAGSGAEGLKILGEEPVALVISDMRMPEMDGAAFLERVRAVWPETVRVLLTGYADVGSTIAAINKGEIYRYIAKPWEDNDVLLLVRHALERRALEREKARLERLAQAQNRELKELNAGLEAKVALRTRSLNEALESVERAHARLKRGFFTSIRIFSNLIELRDPALAGYSRRVTEHARRLAQKLGLAGDTVQDLTLAGLLHDIGRFGLNDKLFAKPFLLLTEDERSEVCKHPIKGQAALMALEDMQGAATLIRSHHERYDGLGYPDGLRGQDIPQGARILALASDYEALQQGTLLPRKHTPAEALAFLQTWRGTRYDPAVLEAFVGLLAKAPAPASGPEAGIAASALRPGMVIARDLIARDGMLLLARGQSLDQALIAQLRSYEAADAEAMTVYVRAPAAAA